MTATPPTPGTSSKRFRSLLEPALVVVTLTALVLGGIAWLIGWRAVADGCWVVGTLAAVVPAVAWVVVALRRGRAGVDLLAVLSLVGTLWVGEYVAGALIAVMLSTGRALDAAAQRRASRGALENLGHATTLVMDKTGTLTAGHPAVVDVLAAPGRDGTEILRLAASVDQMSPHVLAEAIVTEALARGLSLSMPAEVIEQPGRGVTAALDGRRIAVGKLAGNASEAGWAVAAVNRAGLDGAAIAWVSDDDEVFGAVLLRDPLRRNAPRTVRRLRAAGFNRLVMLTGDRAAPAREVATVLGLDEVCADQSPADKVAAVRAERERAVTVMVGDGVNDAPALAAATVGVAMGARGATASSEAADIVLTTDRLDRLADAMDVARWSRRIAVQSAVAGMVLSLLAMAVAAVGLLPPAAGALLQEGIDVAVILNALRALRGNPADRIELPAGTEEMLLRFSGEHDDLRDALSLLRDAADHVGAGPATSAMEAVSRAQNFLTERLLPHEDAEQAELYPALARPLGSAEATTTMSRTHAEIHRLADRIGNHLTLAQSAGDIQPGQVEDLRACLYGLYAVLHLHFLQEEEGYFTLAATDLLPEDADVHGRPSALPGKTPA